MLTARFWARVVVVVVVVVLTLRRVSNQVRVHRTSSSHSGAVWSGVPSQGKYKTNHRSGTRTDVHTYIMDDPAHKTI